MEAMNERPSPEKLLASLHADARARLRVYLGAAAGVGKTCQMLEDARQLIQQGIDVVVTAIETHGRADTAALLEGLEQIPLKPLAYRGATLYELDLDAVIARRPAVVVIDELAHTNAPGVKHQKRYEDVLEILANGSAVITAVNVQHLESLNDVVAQITGVRVRETIPDSFLQRADEVVNVDVSVETLRTRLRQGKIYGVEKIEQALNNFFRKGNLTALRELALRQTAQNQDTQARAYREREGLEAACLPERVMVCMASRGSAKKLLRLGSRIAGRLAHDWYAVYVETPREAPDCIKSDDLAALRENLRFAEALGARVVKLEADNVTDALIGFARREGITHVIFGQSARSRWDILWHGSIINRFLEEVRDVAVQVVPFNQAEPAP
ncbi:MAG: histidine kinase [Acidobacteria bacterium]|nr:histidine kinase [Acidobacteriota bacterium]